MHTYVNKGRIRRRLTCCLIFKFAPAWIKAIAISLWPFAAATRRAVFVSCHQLDIRNLKSNTIHYSQRGLFGCTTCVHIGIQKAHNSIISYLPLNIYICSSLDQCYHDFFLTPLSSQYKCFAIL